MRRNVSRWRKRCAALAYGRSERTRGVYVMLTAVQTLDEGVHCYRRRVVAGALLRPGRRRAATVVPATPVASVVPAAADFARRRQRGQRRRRGLVATSYHVRAR